METQQPSGASARSSREIPVGRPRWSFTKGLFVGAAIEVPMFSLVVLWLARVGIGNPDVSFTRVLWLTYAFAGLAAVLTAGSIGRLAARVTIERGRKHAILVAARAHAAAGAGLILIAVIPHGHLPAARLDYLFLVLAGVLPGAACGAAIGYVCSRPSPVGFADVWSLAARPSGALRQLLDPRDIVKLGAALRTRTSTLFEGIFEPAPKREEPKPEPPKPEPPKPGPTSE